MVLLLWLLLDLSMDWRLRCKRGVTIIELLVALSIVAIISGISVTSYNSYRSHNSLNISTLTVVEAIRYTQSNAQAVKNNASWSLSVDEKINILKDGQLVESFNLTPGVQGNSVEITFQKVTGFSNGGSIIINFRDQEKIITINEKGTISY